MSIRSRRGATASATTPQARFGGVNLGVAYVTFDVPPNSADAIARFYRDVLDAPASVVDDHEGRRARIHVGKNQYLAFRETDAADPAL